MNRHEDSEGGLNKGWLAAGVVLAGLIAGLYFYSRQGNTPEREPSQTELAERARKKAEWQESCDVLAGKKDTLKKRHFVRRGILDSLSKLGTCLEPEGKEFDFPAVCRALAKGIRETDPTWNWRLHPLYTMVYAELKCEVRDTAAKTERERAINDLLNALENSEALKRYRLLDYQRPLDSELCEEARVFANEGLHQRSFDTLVDYVIEKGVAPGFDEKSPLGEIIGRAKKNFTEKYKRPPNGAQDIRAYAASRIGLITLTVKFPWLCSADPQTLIDKYDPALTADVLTEKRRLALPVVRQLIELLKAEPDEEKARRVTEALLTLARNMSKEKR